MNQLRHLLFNVNLAEKTNCLYCFIYHHNRYSLTFHCHLIPKTYECWYLSCLFMLTVNVIGFVGTSTLPGIVYRGYTFPGLGFMLKKSFYIKEMKNKMATCCLKRYCLCCGWENCAMDASYCCL